MSELESTNVDVITTKIKDSLDSRKNLVTQLKSLNKKRLDMRDEIITITSQLGEQQAVLEPLYGEAGKNRKERQGLLNEKKQIWTQINDKDDVIKQNESLSKDELIKEKYQGIRPAPGYPSCPDHSEKDKIWKILNVEKNVSISLTESRAMYPEASVCGWYFSHPKAKYFSIGNLIN